MNLLLTLQLNAVFQLSRKDLTRYVRDCSQIMALFKGGGGLKTLILLYKKYTRLSTVIHKILMPGNVHIQAISRAHTETILELKEWFICSWGTFS